MARRGGRGAAREMERSGVGGGGWRGAGIGLLHNAEVERGEQRAVARDKIKSRVERRRDTVSLCRSMERCPEWKPVD